MFDLDYIRTQIRLKYPYYAILADLLDWSIDESIPTACTNGKWVKFNPDFMAKLSKDQQIFVAIHEIWHIIKKHPFITKKLDLDPKRANEAFDYGINIQMSDEGFFMPSGGLIDPQYRDMTDMEIYRALEQQAQQSAGGSGSGSGESSDGGEDSDQSDNNGDSDDAGASEDGSEDLDGEDLGMGGFVPCDEMTDTEVAKQVEKIEKAVEAAAQMIEMAKLAGKGTGALQAIAAANRKPEIDWKRQLARFLTAKFPAFRAWKSVDRRLWAAGIAYPGTVQQSTAELVFAIDTSGSMPSQTIANLAAEIENAFNTCNLSKVHVLFFDSSVWEHQTYTNGQKFKLPEKFARGGTDFSRLFEYVKENCPQAKALIAMTDGYDTFPSKAPGMPLLWAMTTSTKPPFGTIIEVK